MILRWWDRAMVTLSVLARMVAGSLTARRSVIDLRLPVSAVMRVNLPHLLHAPSITAASGYEDSSAVACPAGSRTS